MDLLRQRNQMLARPVLPGLHARCRDDEMVAVQLAPRQPCYLIQPEPGEQQDPIDRTDRIAETAGRPPEREQLLIVEATAARDRRADDLRWLQPVARRAGEAVDILIDHPVEEPLGRDQEQPRHLRCTCALLAVDDL